MVRPPEVNMLDVECALSDVQDLFHLLDMARRGLEADYVGDPGALGVLADIGLKRSRELQEMFFGADYPRPGDGGGA
ncbi:hypothetical protein ACFQI3_02010 [Hansschlegelia quercus]|uniref:Uncharacterized protein n=1 Tax=Hansschlegelia quercus TaxID=2528245 RepID=A0A4Q9GKJ0_9HYPH|nr:hypothetical protein [Hansschlegelia quercus]TBN54712.1 hypothetical protein EYR15_00650 [Hansschlegelia quercus]